MSSHKVALVVTCGVLFLPASVSAQGLQALERKLDELYNQTVEAMTPVLDGTALMMEASGKKDQAAQLREQSEALTKSVAKKDRKVLSKTVTMLVDASGHLQDIADSTAEFSAEANGQFREGIVKYLTGTIQILPLVEGAAELPKLISGAKAGLSPMKLRRAKNTLSLANVLKDAIPALASSSKEGVGAITKFAESRGIEVPPDLLGSIN